MKTLREDWKNNWAKSPWYQKVKRIDPDHPYKKYRSTCNSLTKAQASLLIQIRSGHILLGVYLHCINQADTPYCKNCQHNSHEAPETLIHFLFECSNYNQERHRLERTQWQNSCNLKGLLSTEEGIKALLHYIRQTERLKDSLDDTTRPQWKTLHKKLLELRNAVEPHWQTRPRAHPCAIPWVCFHKRVLNRLRNRA